ncbi:hypothetical protein [Bacillus thuringiensis]|uniref:hypothetical protein n=1 Tax=Bacillus thuringiensis TaxID=1428 RepID=UPI0003454F71
MIKNNFKISNIPAVLWGDKSDKIFIAVHGNMSNKEDTIIQILAEEAKQKGYQVLSFDLPEHGERKDDNTPCKVQICVSELSIIMNYAKEHWKEINVFACSMGAYFSLLAYQNDVVEKALFLSPVVNMERIIEKKKKKKKKKKSTFHPKYKEFLRETGKAPVEELMKKYFEIDIRNYEFWNKAFIQISKDIDEYLQLM